MNLFDRHRKFRNKLSAYIDGELSNDAVRSLDAHLESCDTCRLELDEMRATVDALRSIPEVEAPRSFRLTPAMVAERRPVPSWNPSPGLMNGMRMATAGLTMAFAVVLFADLGGSDSESRTVRPLSQAAPANLATDSGVVPALAEGGVELDAALPVADGSRDAPTGIEDTYGEFGSGGAQTDDFDVETPLPVAPGDELQRNFTTASDLEKTLGGTQADLAAASDESFDALLAAEIGLGAALALAAAGTAGLTFARFRARRD